MLENNPIKAWPEWKIEKQLGEGTYGAVYQVVRTEYNFENRAAVKVIDIPPHASELNSLYSEGLTLDGTRTYLREIMDDFIGEIRLMETLKGTQNIVGIEDYKVLEKEDSVGWEIYIRMELLTPLQNCTCSGAMSETQVIQLGREICAALMLCASKGIIHRDIKPENIFINDFGHFKLGDFGVARKLEGMTSGLSRRGTPNYMAPEVAKGEPYDARADIYSLGLVLYRLLNKNRLPFLDTDKQLLSPGERRKALERRLGGEALPLPSEASPALGGVILKACAHDPNARFASAEDLDRALACLDTQPLAGTAGEAYTYQQPASISMTEPLVYSAPATPPVPAGTGPAPKKIRWGVIVPVFCAAILSISLGAFFLAGSLANRVRGHRDTTSDDITSIGAAKDPADGFGGGGLADPNSSFGGGSLTGPDSSFGGGSLTGPDSGNIPDISEMTPGYTPTGPTAGGSGPANSGDVSNIPNIVPDGTPSAPAAGSGDISNTPEFEPDVEPSVPVIDIDPDDVYTPEFSDDVVPLSVGPSGYSPFLYFRQPGYQTGQGVWEDTGDFIELEYSPDFWFPVVSATLQTDDARLIGSTVQIRCTDNSFFNFSQPFYNGYTFDISAGTYLIQFIMNGDDSGGDIPSFRDTYQITVTFDHNGSYWIYP